MPDKATAPRASTASVCLAIPVPVTACAGTSCDCFGHIRFTRGWPIMSGFDWRPAENYHSVHYGTIREAMPLTMPEKMSFTDGY